MTWWVEGARQTTIPMSKSSSTVTTILFAFSELVSHYIFTVIQTSWTGEAHIVIHHAASWISFGMCLKHNSYDWPFRNVMDSSLLVTSRYFSNSWKTICCSAPDVLGAQEVVREWLFMKNTRIEKRGAIPAVKHRTTVWELMGNSKSSWFLTRWHCSSRKLD